MALAAALLFATTIRIDKERSRPCVRPHQQSSANLPQRRQLRRRAGLREATRGTGSVYDLVFSPDKEQKFIYMIDAIKGEVRIVGRASNETLGRSGRLHVVGNEEGLDCAAANHPPTPKATIGLQQWMLSIRNWMLSIIGDSATN
jgi:hypothetical protein